MSGINISDMAIAERKLQEILKTFDVDRGENFRAWFLEQFVKCTDAEECSLENFAAYVLNTVHQNVDGYLRSNDVGNETTNATAQDSKSQTPVRSNKAKNSSALSVIEPQILTSNSSFPMLGTPTSRSFSQSLPRNASTPVRRGGGGSHQQAQSQQHQRRSVESGGRSFDKSRNSTGDGNMSSSSLCLGDFLVLSSSVSSRLSGSNKKRVPNTTTAVTQDSGDIPKKRVVPLRIAKNPRTPANQSNSFGASSSFSQDNNILKITQTEIADWSQGAVEKDRKAIKKDLFEANSVLKIPTPVSTPTKSNATVTAVTCSLQQIELNGAESKLPEPAEAHINFNEISAENLKTLQQLAAIYTLLIDMDFVTNILSELAFLLTLLNCNVSSAALPNRLGCKDPSNKTAAIDEKSAGTCRDSLTLLGDFKHGIYFALRVLEGQRDTLTLLDIKSLGVVLQYERLAILAPDLKHHLGAAFEHRQTLPSTESNAISFSGSKNVCFQEDTDSREFFPSNNEFGAFKTQRDLFYAALKLWENHHMYPSWSFAKEVSPKIREIFHQSENPINMAHFAKLFVSQLLISASEQTSPEEIGFGEDVDLNKLNKLSQRFVALSNFNVHYQFPRDQAFFRNFIEESRSLAFVEHLKIVLYSELISLNNSTFEELDLLADEGGREEPEERELIVRPPVLASMLILAKFLGFVSALPFQYGTNGDTQAHRIQSYQLRLRQIFQPPVDVCQLVEVAIEHGRYLITLPWLVQYMAMLDDVTLKLETFVSATQKLYALYLALGNRDSHHNHHHLTPISAFIVRCCLGWLFEQKPIIVAEYYNYCAVQRNCGATSLQSQPNRANAISCQFKPIFESILCVACPFLAEFRVAIMPAKCAQAKYVSRTGRYRYVTPLVTELPVRERDSVADQQQQQQQTSVSTVKDADTSNSKTTLESAAKNRQKKLIESFLHAQNSSMRRLIDFLIERTYKCVVRDAQFQILVPSKSAADSQVNEITSCNKDMVFTQLKSIYQNARKDALKQWDNLVPELLSKRVAESLHALLPAETAPILTQVYSWHIQTNAKAKIQQWRHMNLEKNDFYCNDLQEVTTKVCNANSNRVKQASTHTTELKLISDEPSISDLIDELQHWLYTTSFASILKPEQYSTDSSCENRKSQQLDDALIDFLRRLALSFENTLPTIYYRLVAMGLVQLLQHLITARPECVTKALIEAVCDFWLNDKMRIANENANAKASSKADETNTTVDIDAIDEEESSEQSSPISSETATVVSTSTVYQALITAPFIESLGTCRTCYEKLEELLVAMIRRGVISLEIANEMFVILFKSELQPGVFNEISKTLSTLSKETGGNPGADSDDERKSQLFMEVLADFSRDLDNF